VKSARSRTILSAALIAVALLSSCGGSSPKPAATTVTAPAPQAASTPLVTLEHGFTTVIARVTPQVVQISNASGLGSGVVFDSNGDVVTNAHVVAGGGAQKITDWHGRSYGATVVGKYTPDDLAVVHAQNASLSTASFGNSSALRVGDIVLAIGNPLGLRSSVTEGIVSALGRTVDEPNGSVLPNTIQTSAAINPGNSGGALVDLTGAVVGIPTLAATDAQLGGAAPGIGFAVPSSVVTNIAGQIIKYGRVINSHRAFLGVSLATGLVTGAVVASVERGGPAARAGIVAGDVITSLNGQPVASPGDAVDVLATLTPGQTVKVGITKPGGGHATVEVKLGQYPGSRG
jgi:S1-C subfamily serine protease